MKKKKIEWYGIIREFITIFLAILIAIIIITLVADNPLKELKLFFYGPLMSKRNFFNVLENMIPLVFTGLAINVMHRSGLFSMIADSSFYFAGVMAAALAIQFPMPNILHQIVIIVVSTLVGGIIGALPVWIQKYTGANVLVTSLMMNYIFYNWGYWIIRAFFIDPENGTYSVSFPETASLGKMVKGTSMHYGIIIMIVIVIVIWFVLEKSIFGQTLSIIGSNSNFAKYAGIKVAGVVTGSQFIGGMISGLGGSVEMIGMSRKFQWVSSQNYVWDGLLINLLARTKPLLIPIAAFGLSYIRVGALIMSRSGGVDSSVISIVQGVMILLISSERFQYYFKKKKEEKEALQNLKLEGEYV